MSRGRESIQEHLDQAESWNEEAYRKIKASRSRAWMLTAAMFALALTAVGCLALALPLKRTEVVPVLVNRDTGEVRVTQSLTEERITPNEAITQAQLVRYVVGRETYERRDMDRLYRRVARLSTDDAFADFKRRFTADDPDVNRISKWSNRFTREVRIKSVSMLNERTGQVRFYTLLKGGRKPQRTDWIATIGFKYVNEPKELQQRLKNPLGFQVTSYRADPEMKQREG